MIDSSARTVVIVDPHPLWLGAITPVVAACNLTVVGSTTSAAEGLDFCERHRPDVLVTGLAMPPEDMAGIELIREVGARGLGTRTVVVSGYSDMSHIDAALEAGAVAYVIKTAHPEDIASAIRQAFDQSLFLAGSVARPAPAAQPRESRDPAPELTKRELTILQLAAEGYSNAELARKLWVTEQTVKFHLSNVYRKLDVANRTEAGRWAQRNGLLPASPVESAA